uniref:Ovule protein n=1 Tax=Haemonchus contortus TaxID=6289 RepID=A0A7I4YW82_HAECO
LIPSHYINAFGYSSSILSVAADFSASWIRAGRTNHCQRRSNLTLRLNIIRCQNSFLSTNGHVLQKSANHLAYMSNTVAELA